MSRARSIEFDGRTHWYDTNQDGQPARSETLELLAAIEDVEIDDLLDSGLQQGAAILRIREALQGDVVPPDVIERRRIRKERARQERACMMCDAKGKSTRHHFVPRFIMRELENYQAYAARSRCTIPLCVDCHRGLHARDGAPGKSIVPYLNTAQAAFAQKMLDELQVQHPKIYELLSGGNEWTYEGILFRDHREGRFLARAAGEEFMGNMQLEQQTVAQQYAKTSVYQAVTST